MTKIGVSGFRLLSTLVIRHSDFPRKGADATFHRTSEVAKLLDEHSR